MGIVKKGAGIAGELTIARSHKIPVCRVTFLPHAVFDSFHLLKEDLRKHRADVSGADTLQRALQEAI